MPKRNIDRVGDNLITERTLSRATGGALYFKLIHVSDDEYLDNLGLEQGQRIEVSQSIDGKRGSWRVIE
jgi:hypothetical protein